MLVISIVPRLLPAIDGVGDYALNLACQLRKDFGIETHFIIGEPTWAGATEIEGFPISQVTVRSAVSLLSLLDDRTAAVLLHYVGYGYAKRGCPFWLVDALQHWQVKNTNQRLVTMFHEVSASGPPWTSTFWLSPVQRHLATRLAQLSDRCLTSKQLYAEILQKVSRGKHAQIPTLPVFSNIGEPAQVSPLAERSRQLVVFGGRGRRLRVYQESWAELSYACQRLEIEKIVDIGPSTGLTLSTVSGVPIVEMGQLSAPDISSILSKSLAGFCAYHPAFLAKSTIFAAYCAHSLLSVSSRSTALPTDGIEAGKHYWLPDEQETSLKTVADMQAIADHAYIWYQNHNLSVQAKTFAEQLMDNRVAKPGIAD